MQIVFFLNTGKSNLITETRTLTKLHQLVAPLMDVSFYESLCTY